MFYAIIIILLIVILYIHFKPVYQLYALDREIISLEKRLDSLNAEIDLKINGSFVSSYSGKTYSELQALIEEKNIQLTSLKSKIEELELKLSKINVIISVKQNYADELKLNIENALELLNSLDNELSDGTATKKELDDDLLNKDNINQELSNNILEMGGTKDEIDNKLYDEKINNFNMPLKFISTSSGFTASIGYKLTLSALNTVLPNNITIVALKIFSINPISGSGRIGNYEFSNIILDNLYVDGDVLEWTHSATSGDFTYIRGRNLEVAYEMYYVDGRIL